MYVLHYGIYGSKLDTLIYQYPYILNNLDIYFYLNVYNVQIKILPGRTIHYRTVLLYTSMRVQVGSGNIRYRCTGIYINIGINT